MKKRGLLALLFGMAVMSFTILNSCDIDIGLGSAVDTEPPVLKIENPPSSKVIRDSFVLSGTYSDDGTISDITVVLESTEKDDESETAKYEFKGVLGDKNSWSCVIDPTKKGSKIKDGKYEATVTISDNGGHHSVSSRSFVIDNTPPVVVLERPSSGEEADNNSIESYGQYFTIEGQASDVNDIEKIVIKFYDKEHPETLICEKEITSVPPTISLDVAKFGDEIYTDLYLKNLENINLETLTPEEIKAKILEIQEKSFYCEIIAYDGAKRYPEKGKESAEDDLGNYESSYILWSDWEDFRTNYMAETGTSSKIKLPELYSLKVEQTTTDSSRTIEANDEDNSVTRLFGKAISRGSFKLNPLNNPTFAISGMDVGVENDVENEQPLTIQLSKGLDGIILDKDSLAVYLIPVTFDEDGKEVSRGAKIYPQNSTYQPRGDGQFLTIIQKENCKDAEGNPVSLEYGNTYVLGVDGADIEHNKIVASIDGKEFFIRFKAKNVAPNLNITEPSLSNTYLKKGEKLLIKGTTSVPDGYPTVTITCKKGAETEGTPIYEKTVTSKDIDKVEGGYIYYNFEFEVPTEPETEDDFWFDQSNPDQYVFDITSTLESMPTSRTKTVIYDVKAPTITPISILPEAEKYTGEEDRSKAAGSYLNGIVTMKVSIIDDYTTVQSTLEEGKDRRPYFIIVDEDDKEIAFRVGTETKKTEKHYITTPANQSFEIHTEDIATGTESKTVTVKIYAQDTAGNEAYAEKQYIVDQTTDIPVIFPYNHNNLTLTYATVDDVNKALRNKVRKSIITKGSDLQLRINDDDGIAKYTFKISDKNTGDNLAAPDGYNNQELSDTPTTYDFRYTVPNISGKYKCSIEVRDTTGKTNAKEFWIVVTEAAPQLSIDSTSPDNKIITLSNGLKEDSAKVSFTNTVSIDSGYENFIVKRVENVNGTDEETILYGQTEEDKLNGHSFTDTFTPSANRSENKIKYVVIDEMNNPGEREFVYNVDSTKPVIEENTITVPSNKQTESVSFRFEATAKDAAGSGELKPSGVSKIQYTFDSAKAAGNIKTIPGVTSLSETIYFNNEDYSYAFGTEGQKTIYIRAIDDVGNIGDWVSKNFMFDTKAPSVNIASYKRASESAAAFAENTASKSFESGEAFTLSGTVSDNNGIEAFEIWQIKDPADGDDSLGIKLTDIDVSSIDSDGKWTVTGLPRNEENITQPQSVIASGNYKYTVRAIDTSAFGTGSNAQSAKKTDETVNVKIDRTAPVVTISLATGNTSDSTAYGENSIKGSAYTFRGTAEDTGESSSGFDTLYYAFTTTEVEPSAYTLFVKPTTSSWSIPMNLITATKTNSGTSSDDTLTEGKHFLYIKGKDKAGNYSETKHVAFMVDQNAPEVSCQVYKNNTNETAETPVDGTVYLNAQSDAQSYTLRGIAWDANGISRVTVDGVPVTVGTDGKWSKEITVQGKNNHEIVVYDNSGNTSISAKQSGISCSVIFDTALPIATIEGFDTSATQIEKWLSGTGDYYINGTASDGNGSGLKDIKIKVSDAAWATLPLTSNWSYKYSIPSNLEENSFEATSYHTVIIKVVDNANNEKSITYYFRYDKTQPEANLSISKSGYLNAADLADIVISGYAHDGREEGRALEYAKIIVNNDEDNTIDVTTAAFAYNTTAGENYGNFSKVGLASADYPDGRYEFKLDVKDKAHNTPSASSALTASFVVDKTAPSITKRAFILNGTEIPSSLSSNKSKAKIHVEFDEVNPEAVYYYVDDRSDETLTQENVPVADWINMNFNGSNNSWTAEKDCSFNDGNGLVYIKIEDKAGNVSYASPLSYEVDTKAPDVCTLGTVSVKNDDNTLTALSGTKLVNGTKPVVFTVTATDHNDNHDATAESDPAKVASVSVKAGGGVKAVTADFIYTHTTAGVWTITIPANQLDNGAVSVTVTDIFGNSKNYNSLFTLELDDKYPSLGNYSLASSYDATSTGAATKTFYMNNHKNGLKLEGIAKDDRINDGDNNGEIEKVELTLTAGTNSQTLTSNSSAWTFEIANNEWKNWTGDVTGTITITDKAKNVQAYTDAFTIKFDNAAPKAMHWADNSNKDIYFRIGNADNDKKESDEESDVIKWETGDDVGDGTTTADKANTDVGKKYSYGSWGNDSTIEIRGNFYEAATGSGLKTIYYAIFDSNPVTTNVTINGEELTLKDAFESGLLKAKSQSSNVNAIGSFAPLETDETRKVPYTAADGSRTSQEVVSNFRTSLPGFNGVENYLLLVAEDYVGNRAVDDLENSNTAGNATWNSSKTYYHINKDATAPSISGSVTKGSYTNGSSGNIVVSGTASDNENGSGLGSVKIRITDNNNETVEIENSTEINATIIGNTWEVAIPASTFNSGVYTVYAKATDIAGEGNSKEVNAGTITFDNTPPTIDKDNIKFTETKETSTTNVYKSDSTYYLNNTTAGKTFKLSGLAQDNLAVDSVNITVKNNAGTVVESLSQEKPTNGTWDFTIGNWSSLTTGATIVIDAKDKAGNTLAEPVEFTVKFDIKAPEVVSANLKVPEPSDTEKNLFKFEGENGSVTDSGIAGTLSGFNKVEFAFTTTNDKPTATTYIETATVDANGAWSSNVEFKKPDLQSVFGTPTASDEGTKYLWVRAYDNAGNVSGWVSKDFVYDTATPTISFSDTEDNETTHITTNPTADSWRKYGFDLKVNASDSYGVKKVEIEYGTTTVDITNSASNGTYSKSFKVGTEESAATKLDDGPYTFKVIVTDKSGKTNYETRRFKIDTTAPAVSTKTLDKTPDYSKGENTVGWYMTNQIPVKVTVSDGSGSGVTSVQVSTETEVTDGVTVLKNPTSLILSGTSWSGTIVCKEQGLNTIYIKATDATGNSNVISTNDSIPVNIDTTAPLAPVFLGAGTTPASEITSLLVNKESNVTVYAALKDAGDSDKQTGIASSAAFVQKNQTGKSSSVTLATILAFTPEWTSNHDYSEGNVVKYSEGANTKLYSCSSEHTSGTTFDTSKWTDLSGYAFWSYEIKKADMTNGGINFTVKDNAGNTADYTLFQMVVDTEKPTVTFNDISNLNIERASEDETVYVNGTITLSGSANDNQKLSSLTVKYKKHDDADDDSKWTLLPPPANASLSSWNRTLNTTSLDDETEYDIRVIANDAAGWISTPVTKTVKVSQDTDRPIITLTSPSDITALSTGSVNWESRTISGTVSDDDNGIISIGYYVGDEIVYDTDEDETSHYEDLPINNGIWKFNLDDDGSQKVFFKVTTGGKDYYSNVSETWSDAAIYDDTNKRGTFKLTDGTHKYGYKPASGTTMTKSELALVVDTIAPDVETPEYTIDNGSHWQTGVGAQTFGGTKNNKIIIRQSAWDRNDINKMTVKVIKTVNGGDVTTPVFEGEYAKATSIQLEANANGKRYRRFTTAEINTTGWDSTTAATETTSSVSYRVEIVMSDGIKETTSKLDLTVDNTAPNISFSGPASGTHSGEITVYGTTDEVGGTTISYTVSTYGDQAHKPSSAAGKTLISWTGYTVSSDGTTTTPKTNGTITPPEGQTSVSVPDYTVVKNSNVSWYVYFDNDTTDTVRSHTTQLKNYTVSLGLTTRDALNTNHTFTDLVNFYIWIKAEDAVGNYAEYPQLVCIDPQGDRPTVSLLSPEHPGDSLGGTVKLYGSAEDSNGTVDSVWVQLLSGKNGTGYGAVTKNTSMEITDFKPKDKDVEFWLAHFNGTNDNGVYYIEPGTNNAPVKLKLSSQNVDDATEFNSSTHTPENCYIKANFSGTSWNLKINKDGEFDPAATDEIANDMAVRVYARDNEKNMSYAVTRYFVMDKDNPLITNVKLKQYAADDTAFANPTASQDARVGMYVKGKWYLEFTTTDNSALDRIFLVDKDGGETDLYTGISAEGNVASKDVRYALPTDTAGVGVFKRTIKASDVSSNGVVHTGSYDIEVYYDNEAPKLLIDTASDFNINPQVKQKDGFYELKSKVSDSSLTGTPSGVKAVGFYFLRRESDGKGKIYDPMLEREEPISTDDLDYADGLYWLSGAITCNESGSITLGTGLSDNIDYVHVGSYIRLDGVMYKITSVSGTTITIEESHGSYTTAQIALAQFVDNRKSEYEAAKTKNSTGYYTSIKNDDGDSMIEELGGTSVVSSWQGSIVSRNIPDGPIEIHYTAFDESLNYAVGVVGNKDLATYKTYTTPEVDELWNKDAGGVRTTLKTPSLDDQYASYVYTYREEDGKAIPAYICNNAPRLAGVTIAVDYTGSENPDINNAKKTTYYYNEGYMLLGNDGKSTKKPVEVTDNLVVAANVVDGNGNAIEGKKRGYTTIKGKTWIIPEMVGGNGKLWYEYKIYSSNDDGIKQTTDTDLKKSSNGVSFLREGFADYDTYTAYDTANQKYINAHSAAVLDNDGKMTEAGTIVHSVSDLESLNDTTLASPYWFDYTIYDSTETLDITEATVTAVKLTNNQKATISIAMAVEVKDETPPNTKIDDLYWNSSTENSVYTNPSTDKLEGHVELKDYLGTGFTAANYGTDDDKISGKVVFRGYAYDNKLLKSLNWGIKNKLTGTEDDPILEAWPQTYITPVSFNAETQKWGVKSVDEETEEITWTDNGYSGSSSIGLPYYYFKVYDDADHGAYLNENGHRVYWELTIDTSYVQQPGQASQNAAWAVGKDLYVYVEATDSKGQTTTMNPATTEIKTTGEDSELLRPNYKVDVVPYITGIKSRLDDNRSSNGRYQIADNETGVELIGYNLKQGSANLAISVPSTTGEYSIETVTGYPTINNMNNNNAVGGISDTVEAAKVRNKYNYQPSTYNESLTDDVYIQLWQFNNRAAATYTGVGFVAEPVMRYNPANNNLGFAFSNGANKFSMSYGQNSAGNSTQTSYTVWEMNYAKYIRNALAFDELGRSHGLSVGIDTEPSSGKAGRMNYFYSVWGQSDTGSQSGNFNNTNNLHIDTIGIPNADDYTDTQPTGGEWGATVIVEERFKATSMVAANHGTNNYPTVYIAYYDDVLERIVFRWGTINGTEVKAYNNLTTTTEGSHSFPLTTGKYSLIAGGTSVDGNTALTPYNSGEYVDLGLVKGDSTATDVVCVVWYDAILGNLMYSYKINPCNENFASTDYTDGHWTEAKVLKQNCGEYCKIAVDKNGGIHIAAYDSGNKGVGYVYLPSYDTEYNEATDYYLIDAMNGPFDEIGIDVGLSGEKAVPTIGYYANGTPKVAEYSAGITASTGKPEQSWENGKFTGKWDVCYVPTDSKLLKDHISIVWPKNANGVIVNNGSSAGFSNAAATSGVTERINGRNQTVQRYVSNTVTGNGTDNQILGYAIREGSKGYLEIAQRK